VKKAVLLAVKIGIAAGLIAWLVRSGKLEPEKIWTAVRQRPLGLAVAFLIYNICILLTANRWRMLVVSQGIPARTVWVDGHCYPEFHLVDADGHGAWFPCQAAGTRAFGAMPDQLPILQKGDNFRDPDRPGKSLRYVSEFMTGSAVGGGAAPVVEWIREGA